MFLRLPFFFCQTALLLLPFLRFFPFLRFTSLFPAQFFLPLPPLLCLPTLVFLLLPLLIALCGYRRRLIQTGLHEACYQQADNQFLRSPCHHPSPP